MSIGHRGVRFDAHSKVIGATQYPDDGVPDDALYAFAVFSNQPHARMLSLSTDAAEAIDGVVAVLTATDVPVNDYGLNKIDQPVLIGVEQSGRSRIPSNVSRWEADHVAVVVAETDVIARQAAAALEIEWESLPVVDSIELAKSDEVLLHPEEGTNVYHSLLIRKGDIDAGWESSDVVIEGTYELPHQEHAFLQVESATGWIDDEGRVTVETSGQWTHADRGQIAHALDLAEEEVRVIYAATGGAFGGKEDTSLQIVVALAAQAVAAQGINRPVHSCWSRAESIVGHHKRHRATIHAKLGATSDGMITAVEADVWLDAGAYNYTSSEVLGNVHMSVAGAYEVPNARIDSRCVYTSSVPGGAFRGFGGPQGAFVAETQMNKLAEALGMDPVEVRQKNLLKEGSDGISQVVMPPGVTLAEVTEACAEAMSQPVPSKPFVPIANLPSPADQIKRGQGFAVGFKNVGFGFGFPERCEAEIRLHGSEDETLPVSVEVLHSGAEVGQGAHQAILQMAAEATGVSLDQVTGTFSDTAYTGDAGSSSASRLTWMAGNSILGAAEEAHKSWSDGDRPAIGKFRFTPPPTEELDEEIGKGQPNFAYGYMAQAVDISVDVGTGIIRVDRVVSTHDVGKAINPNLVKGQIEGAVVQAHGYVLSEDLQIRDGRITNPRLSEYLIPGIGDVPDHIDSVILELAEPLGPWGARGMAEMPYITYAPAVIAAVHDATGVWIDQFPLTPSRVLAALRSPD